MMMRLGRVARFGIVGALATAIHVGVTVGLIEVFSWRAFWASLLAFCTAVGVSYVGHHAWTFGARGNHGRHLPRFVVVSAAGLGLNQAIVFIVVDGLRWHYSLAITAVVLIVPAFGFIASRNWAFSRRRGYSARRTESRRYQARPYAE
jgi:putative flippase GtrA